MELEEKAKRKAARQAKHDSENIDLYNRELDRKMAKEERKRQEKRKMREEINAKSQKDSSRPRGKEAELK